MHVAALAPRRGRLLALSGEVTLLTSTTISLRLPVAWRRRLSNSTGRVPEVTEQVGLRTRPEIAVVASAAILHHWDMRRSPHLRGCPGISVDITYYQVLRYCRPAHLCSSVTML